ncbi:MAG: histidine kinase dimerization/phospho-acceptor domain-containing protein [Janthinobacterium lividum]
MAEMAAFAERAQRLNHDLRTPIGTMATALELLRAGGTRFSDDDLETLEVLQRQVVKLTALAESLRGLACDLEAKSGDSARREGCA